MKKKILLLSLALVISGLGLFTFLRFQTLKRVSEFQKPEGKTYQCGEGFRLTVNSKDKPSFFDKQLKIQARVEILPSINLIPPLPLNEGSIDLPFFAKASEQKIRFQKISNNPEFQIPELHFILGSASERRIEIPQIILGAADKNHSELSGFYASLSNCDDLTNALAQIGFNQFQEHKVKEAGKKEVLPIINEFKFQSESKLANKKLEVSSQVSMKSSELSELADGGNETKISIKPLNYSSQYQAEIEDVKQLKEKNKQLWTELFTLLNYFKEASQNRFLQSSTQPYTNHLEKIQSFKNSLFESMNQYKNIQISSETNWGGLEVSVFKQGQRISLFNLQNMHGKLGGDKTSSPFKSSYQIEKLSVGGNPSETFEVSQLNFSTDGYDARGQTYTMGVINSYFESLSNFLPLFRSMPSASQTETAPFSHSQGMEDTIFNSALKMYAAFLPDAIEYKLSAEKINFKDLKTQFEMNKPSLVFSLNEKGLALKWGSVLSFNYSPSLAQNNLPNQSAPNKIEIKNLENQLSYDGQFAYFKLKSFLSQNPETQASLPLETKEAKNNLINDSLAAPCQNGKTDCVQNSLHSEIAKANPIKSSPFPAAFVERFKNYFSQDKFSQNLHVSLKPENSFNFILDAKTEFPFSSFVDGTDHLNPQTLLSNSQNFAQLNLKLEGRNLFYNFLQNIDPSLVMIVPMMFSQLPGVDMNSENINIDLLWKEGKMTLNGKDFKLPELK